MKLTRKFILLLLVTNIGWYGCTTNTHEKNYFSEAGLKLPSTSDSKLNQLMQKFPGLYNELSAAVEKGDKEARPEFTNTYADWLIQIIEAKENLPDNDKASITKELETINKKWVEQIDKLL